MKKLIICFMLCFSIIFSSVTVVSAEGEQYIKVGILKDFSLIVDGKYPKTFGTALLRNNEVMLPSGMFLSLGVPDDYDHLFYSKIKQTLTIHKGSMKLVFKVGSNTAYLNNTPIKITCSPVIYNRVAYYPVTFVAQCFRKQLLQFGSTNSIYMRDKSEFEKTKTILTKSNSNMLNAKNYKRNENFKLTVKTKDSGTITTRFGYSSTVDMINQISLLTFSISENINGKEEKIAFDYCYTSDSIYARPSVTNTRWEEDSMGDRSFDDYFAFRGFFLDDSTYSGMVVVRTNNPNQIKLVGNILVGPALAAYLEADKLPVEKIINPYTEITLNKNTYLVEKIYMKASGTGKIDGQEVSFTSEVLTTYSNINSTGTVSLPEGIYQFYD